MALQNMEVKMLVAMALVAAAQVAAASAQQNKKEVNPTTLSEGESLILGVLPPKCFNLIVKEHDFFNVDCLKFVISKGLGYAIIAGSFILKVPQIMKIVGSKSVEGLSPSSFYIEVLTFMANTAYNLLKGYPVSTWGENVTILVQNIILVLLLWHYSNPPTAMGTRLFYHLVFGLIGFGMMQIPEEYQWVLPSSGIPLMVVGRLPQILSNFKQGHTGQLALVTLVLNFGGSAARMFTTLQETNDVVQLLGYAISVGLNGLLVLQVLMYWSATNAQNKKLASKKKD